MAVNHKPHPLYREEQQQQSLITLKNENDLDNVLDSLFNKERENSLTSTTTPVSLSRKESVEWILRVNSRHGFSALTAVLAVNYFDRFLLNFERDKKGWILQLVAVASLSLAAKVEETNVPLFLDLQVEDAKYLFEAKTIQRMELLILSALKWRMNPVTPLCFVDHIVTRLRLKWEFLRSCENIVLSLVADSRFVGYLPSVLAAATMIHIINQVEPNNAIEYENQILGALKINKVEVDECWEHLSEVVTSEEEKNSLMSSSNYSWAASSSPQNHPIFKKRRVEEQHMKKLPPSQHS